MGRTRQFCLMKNVILLLLVLIGFSGFESCFVDDCVDVSCSNGDCVNGACDCDEGYEGPSCSDERTPDAIRISQITILSFSNYDNGASWDIGNGPDVFPTIRDQDGNDLFTASVFYENAESGNAYTFDCNVNITEVAERHSFVVYDYDSVDPNDYMGGVETNIWQSAKGSGFPSTISTSFGDYSFDLTVSYVFN